MRRNMNRDKNIHQGSSNSSDHSSRRLVRAIGEINEQLISEYDEALLRTAGNVYQNGFAGQVEQADPAGAAILNDQSKRKPKSSRRFWRYGAIAAASLVLVAVGLITASGMGLIKLPIGGGAQSGGGGAPKSDDPSQARTYMFYDGPIFPLTLLEAQENISAIRDISYDFLPYTDITEEYEIDTKDGPKLKQSTYHKTEAKVTDHYLLQNDSDEDITVHAAYPIASSLADLFERIPQVTLDGQSIDPHITMGQYSGGFTGAYGADASNSGQQPQLNLDHIDSWLGYKQLLEDGSYKDSAFADMKYADQTAIVYEFSDFVIKDGEGENPSLAVSYRADEDVKVLSIGFHGGSYPGGDQFIKGFSIPDAQRKQVADDRYFLIALGGDITDISYQGYGNMGWDTGNEMEISASMTRTERSFEETFRELLVHHYKLYDSYNGLNQDDGMEPEQMNMIFEAAYDYLHSFGPLSDRNVDRYTEGMLEDVFSEAVNVDRVIYLHNEITIPAGGTTELAIEQTQRGSHDFVDMGKSFKDAKGYDLTTSLGSNIRFTEQQANIADHGLIKIVDQNFGFDLKQGIRSVKLDPAVEYYYMLVEKVKEKD